VFGIDSMQLIGLVKHMRDESKFLSGTDLVEPPKIFIGAATNPFAEPYEWRFLSNVAKVGICITTVVEIVDLKRAIKRIHPDTHFLLIILENARNSVP